MSPSIETELTEALVQASESIMPRADLADRVRRADRRRRRVLRSVIAVGVAAVTAGSLIAVSVPGTNPRRPSANRHGRQVKETQIVATFGSPDVLAVSARLIYVAEGDGPGAVLAAYDRITGRLVRHIGVPARPSAVRIGPDNLVWLAFYPDSMGGGTGVWLLSPDLRRRSAVNLGTRRYNGAAPFDLLPTGPGTAVLATDNGLATLRLPLPGRPGSVSLRWGPPVPGARRIHGLPVQLGAFNGRVAVRVGSDDGHGLITFAGPHSPVFAPGPAYGVGSMAVTKGSLWTTIFTRNGNGSRGLIRLDDKLRPATPRSVSRNMLLAGAQQAVALGSTVWVILAGSPSVACFTDRDGQVGPVATLSPRLPPVGNGDDGGLAIVGDTLYVINSLGVVSYRVPAACS